MRRSPAEVGHLFKTRRNAKKLKQTDLGPTAKTIAAIERGEVGPKSRSAAPYAEALGWPADAWQRLLAGDDPAAFEEPDTPPLRLSASGRPLDELAEQDPVAYAELEHLAARILDRRK